MLNMTAFHRDHERFYSARFALSLLAVTLLVLGGCAGSGTKTSTPTRSRGPGIGRGGLCAWPVRADKTTSNIAYPDTNATYWGLSYDLAPGEALTLHGRYPQARYASYVTYGPNGGAIAGLADRDIDPDPGSTNPFRVPAARGSGTYTVTIRSTPGTSAPNVLAAQAAPSGATSGATPAPDAASSTSTTPPAVDQARLGHGGPTGVSGTVLYRVYIPNDRNDPTGGAGLPEVHVVAPSGLPAAVPTCAHPGPSAAATDIVNRYQRPATAAPATPVFIRAPGSAANLYPNPDNVYVATLIAYRPGKLVVIRGRAPTFPNTRAGAPITGTEQVRYWSMCTNEWRKPYPVIACAADDQTTLDAHGYYTYMISTPAERPAATPATAGATWLDWGPTNVDALVLMRQMLADPAFQQAAVHLAPGALATTSMGEYAPRAVYCDKTTFARGGFAACGL